MLTTSNYRLPLGRAVTYDAVGARWIAHWPERSAAVREADATPGLGPDYTPVVPFIAPPLTPRFLFDPRFLLATAGLKPGAPLFPEEDLARLRDPVRHSWKQALQNCSSHPLPFTVAHCISRVLAQHHIFAAARVESNSLCGNMDMDDVAAFPTQVFRGPCTICTEGQLLLSTCCREAVVQPKPVFPGGKMQFFMHDSAYDVLSDFSTGWAMYDRGLSLFMASSFRYPMTCRHVLHGLAFDSLRCLARQVVNGPELVLALVFGYLGRQLASSLVAPLFGRTCARHPSLLDAMDRTGPWCCFGLRGELQPLRPACSMRRLRCGHFYALLSPMLLKHHAMVQSAAAVMGSISQTVAVAMYELMRDEVVLAGPEHAGRHRSLMSDWAALWQLFHDPERLVQASLSRLAVAGDYDVQVAPWTPRLFGVLALIFHRCVAVSPIGARALMTVYNDDVAIQDGVPVSRWVAALVPADAVVFNVAVTLRALHRPMPLSEDVCGPLCFADGYDSGVARWVAGVSCLPVRRWWQAAAKRGRSPRRLDDYDSDDTEDYLIEEREEEDEEEEKKVNE